MAGLGRGRCFGPLGGGGSTGFYQDANIQRLPELVGAGLPCEDDCAQFGHDEDGWGVGRELVVEVLGDVRPLVRPQARHLVEGGHDRLAEPALLGVDPRMGATPHNPPKGGVIMVPLPDALYLRWFELR